MQDLFVRTKKQLEIDFQNEFHVLSPHELSPQNFSDVYLSINDFDGCFHDQLKNCAAQYGVKLENQRILFKKIQVNLNPRERACVFCFVNNMIENLLLSKKTEDKQLAESLIRLLPEKQVRVWLLVECARWHLHACGDAVSAARYFIAFLIRMADRIDPEWGANYAERLMWFDRVKKDLETLCLSKEISNEQRIELAQFMCGPFSLASMQADLMTYTIASIKNAPDDKLSKKEEFRYRQYAKILETADVVPAEYKKELEQLLACIKSF